MKRVIGVLLSLFFLAVSASANVRSGISGNVNWGASQISAEVSLDLGSAGISAPGSRVRAERLVSSEFFRLMRPHILSLQVDSSTTVADLVLRGLLSLSDVEEIVLSATRVPPSLSPNLMNMLAFHTISLDTISAALLRHTLPLEPMRTLQGVAAPNFTGIIIIATDSLPMHGMIGSAQPVPSLFPRIWDTDMNLIFERNMLNIGVPAMVRYAPSESIFRDTPSGLSPELAELVGDWPLRIIARGVFGTSPTDIIIDQGDALQIISTDNNRRLLAQGRVAIILPDSALTSGFSGN
ncbi:MAG: polymerase [Spirochaetes bacterium]|nr:polymerase [Spirochaetota bacterium]